MEKPRSHLEIVYDLIEGGISEDAYFSGKIDSAGKVSSNLPELDLLLKDMELFRKYWLSLSFHGRMKVLLHHQFLGIAQRDLTFKYGIPSEKLSFLKGQNQTKIKKGYQAEEVEGKIRSIPHSQAVSNELSATLAIFSRLPITWVKDVIPESTWTVDYFRDLPDAKLTLEEFLNYLFNSEKNAKPKRHSKPNISWVYDIRGIILEFSNSHHVYIRVAIYEVGGFVIEIFGGDNEVYAFKELKDILACFGPLETGYVETVIKKRINPVIVCKSRSEDFDPPIHLKSF